MKITFRPKEAANSYTHAAGIVLSVAAWIVLGVRSSEHTVLLVGFSVYGASLVLLYSASTIYHWLSVSPKTEDRLRRFDHAAIFVLIAGTYTPVCLVTLRGKLGWSLLGVIWTLAVAGVLVRTLLKRSPRWLTGTISLTMGWLAVVALVPLARVLPASGLSWLVAGGILYTAGAIVYATKRPNPLPKLIGSHALFHLLVLAGSASHFVFMARYVLGEKGF